QPLRRPAVLADQALRLAGPGMSANYQACRADSAFLSADRRPTAGAPGGQERRCPPYGSSAESTGDTWPPANVGRTALSCPPTGTRPPPRPADKYDVVRPTGHQRSQPATPGPRRT